MSRYSISESTDGDDRSVAVFYGWDWLVDIEDNDGNPLIEALLHLIVNLAEMWEEAK